MSAASAEDMRPWHPRALREIAVRTVRDAKKDRILGLGAEVAFFALLSLPPTLLAVFGSVGFIAQAIGPQAAGKIKDQIVGALSPFLTGSATEDLGDAIDLFLGEGRAGIASIGVVVALWAASRATNVSIEAVNIAYDLPESRTGVRRRLVAIGITLLGVVAAVGVIPLVVAGPRLGEWIGGPLGLGGFFAAAWRVLYWPSVGLVGIGLLASFYHFAPSWETPWRRDLPGAFVAAILWFAGGAGLRVYAALSIEGNSAYGSLAAPVVILLWLYVTALALLLGAEVNAEIEKLFPTTTEDAPSREEVGAEISDSVRMGPR